MVLQEMFKQLKLPSHNPSAENLEALKSWCETNVSRDIQFSGDLQYQYDNYAQLATQYLTFKEVVATQITQEMPSLGQMNSIQFAATHGYDRYIEQLSVSSAAINQSTTTSSITALHLAARHGHLHAVISLLEKGADPTLMDKNNDLPIMHCLMLSLKSRDRITRERIFHLLNKNIPNLYTHVNTTGNNLLHVLAKNGFTALLAEALKMNPDGVTQMDQDGYQPINLAIRNAHETKEVQELLLSQQPHLVIISNKRGDLPLHDAARYIQDKSLVQAFIKTHTTAGLSLDITNTRDETPLMLAAKAKNRPMIEHLIQQGADPTYKSALGKNVLDYAYQTPEDKAFCEWILEKSPQLDHHQLDELMSHDIRLTP